MLISSAPTSETDAPATSWLERLFWGVVFALGVCWPLLVLGYPPMQDLPNHIARVFVLLNGDDPLLSAHFAIDWRLVPNLAWDMFGVTVGRVLPLEATAKLFMLISLALTMAGVFLLNRALIGRWSFVPLLAVPFLFNAGYSKGFLSFNFGVGLALLACAWWVHVSERSWKRRLAVAAVLSLLLFYAHLVVWGAYGVFVLATKLDELRPRMTQAEWMAWAGRLGRDGLQAVPPLALLLAAALGPDASAPKGQIAGFEQPLDRLQEFWHVINFGTQFPALIALAIAAVAIGLVLAKGRVRIARRRGIISGSIRLGARLDRRGLIAATILFALFMAMPNEILGTYWVVFRLALLAVFFLVASVDTPMRFDVPQARWALGASLGATLLMSGWQAYSTVNSEAGRRPFHELITRIPEGSTLFMEHAGVDVSGLEHDQLGLYHVGAFAVLERRIMVQSLFSYPSQQPIRYRDPRFQRELYNSEVFLGYLDRRLSAMGLSTAAYIGNFDWMVLHGPADADSLDAAPLHLFRQVDAIGDWRLYCRITLSDVGRTCPEGSTP